MRHQIIELALVEHFVDVADFRRQNLIENRAAHRRIDQPAARLAVGKALVARFVTASVSIYPVPVRDNSFTIKSDKDISFVKITNIIGQDISRLQFNDPQQLIKVVLENPKRGMYLVTIIFSDGIRVVKKIMVEQTE